MTPSRPASQPTDLAGWLEHIQRQHWRSVDLTLERVAQVWARLGGSDSGLGRVISVAGTNGKGSCVAMLEAALRDAGWRVGSYTSPHLIRYNERVRVDGHAVDDAALCAAFEEIERARADIPLTYFEFGTLCALLVFRRRVDVSLLEVGMGGRQDAVNLIANDIALITSIGIDHAQWLGADREGIAVEKAGILKPDAYAVCAEPQPPGCIARIAGERGCTLLQSGVDYVVEQGEREGYIRWRSEHSAVPRRWRQVGEDGGLRPPIHGARQADNVGGVAAVLALLAGLPNSPRLNISPKNLADGLAKTRLPGRCQVVEGGGPEIILDVAHNADAAAGLADFLRRRGHGQGGDGKTFGVAGLLADKPVAEIFGALDGLVERWYLASLDGERGQSAAELKAQLTVAKGAEIAESGDCAAAGIAGATTHDSPLAAYLAALDAATAGDRVVVFGSFHTVGAIMAHIRQPPAKSAESAADNPNAAASESHRAAPIASL